MLISLIYYYKNLFSFISICLVIINLIVFLLNLIKLKTTLDNERRYKIKMIISMFMLLLFGYFFIKLQFTHVIGM